MTWSVFYQELNSLGQSLYQYWITPVVEDFGPFFVILFAGIAVSAIFAVLRQFARLRGE